MRKYIQSILDKLNKINGLTVVNQDPLISIKYQYLILFVHYKSKTNNINDNDLSPIVKKLFGAAVCTRKTQTVYKVVIHFDNSKIHNTTEYSYCAITSKQPVANITNSTLSEMHFK